MYTTSSSGKEIAPRICRITISPSIHGTPPISCTITFFVSTRETGITFFIITGFSVWFLLQLPPSPPPPGIRFDISGWTPLYGVIFVGCLYLLDFRPVTSLGDGVVMGYHSCGYFKKPLLSISPNITLRYRKWGCN